MDLFIALPKGRREDPMLLWI